MNATEPTTEPAPDLNPFLAPAVARLLELVQQDGRRHHAIARAAGMSPAQLSQVLTGHRAAPAITTVARILKALGKSWAHLDPPTRYRLAKSRPAAPAAPKSPRSSS